MGDGIFQKIQDLIVEQLDIKKDVIKLESEFEKDLGVDSLDMVELIMSFEEIFEIKISEEDSENFKSIKDVVNYIENNKSTS